MAYQFPKAILNNTDGSVIIHDLRQGPGEPGLHIRADEPNKPRTIYYIEDMFGDKVCRASQGLRNAIAKKLVVEFVERVNSKGEAQDAPIKKESLPDKLEKEIGKVPSRRAKKDLTTPHKGGISNSVLEATLQESIGKENEFDQKRRDAYEEFANPQNPDLIRT